jgi:uncharacterized protein (DUF2147 family)
LRVLLVALLSFSTLVSTHGGEWAQAAKLVAADGAAGDQFGVSVSVSGSTVVVGALLDARGDDDAGASTGSAYVFEKSDNGTWAQAAKLVAADGAAEDNFGCSVSVSGSTVVVGARLDDDSFSKSGSAYVFEKSDVGEWVQTKLTADDAAQTDWFGVSVSVSGSTVVVGAVYRDDDSLSNSGAAYVFEKSDNGTWVQTKLTADDAAADDIFGNSVSVSGSTVAVGARGVDDAGSASGSAYVFEKSDDGMWAQVAKLAAVDGAENDQFGWSVSVSGSTVVVGARLDDDDSLSNSGAAYVFEKSDVGEWVQTKLTADDAAADDIFGNSVSVSGSTVVVGAHFDDDAGDNSGSGYIWMLSIPSLRPCTCCERSMKSMGFTVGAEDCDPEATPDDLDFQSSR